MAIEPDWLPDGRIPYIGLIRILPQDALQAAARKAIQKATSTLSHQKAKQVIQEALETVKPGARQTQMEVRSFTEGVDDYPQCGNDLARLLIWLEHRRPKPGPHPDPWYDFTTIGLIGQLSSSVGGGFGEQIKTGLIEATKVCLPA